MGLFGWFRGQVEMLGGGGLTNRSSHYDWWTQQLLVVAVVMETDGVGSVEDPPLLKTLPCP